MTHLLASHAEVRRASIVLSPSTESATATRTGRGFFKRDRKSTRLNSSHDQISYAVFCLKKKKKKKTILCKDQTTKTKTKADDVETQCMHGCLTTIMSRHTMDRHGQREETLRP